MIYLHEATNAIKSAEPVNQEDVAAVIKRAKLEAPKALLKNLQVDIGSAGYKEEIPSGDIDLMIEMSDVIAQYQTQDDPKDPALAAKHALSKFFQTKGFESNVKGRNVHVGIPYTQQATGQNKIAQVDFMCINDAGIVAPWHQHGPRGSYKDTGFKGAHNFILISSIAKHLGMKFDPFGAHLVYRDSNQPVVDDKNKPVRTMDQVAKVLIGPGAKSADLYTVKSMIAALQKYDPDNAEQKLAQARADAAKGLITMPEAAPTPGTASWFRQMGHRL